MSVTAASIAGIIESFILSSSSPAVIEDGEMLFDFADTRYSISTENDRCLLHLWSSEKNCVRRVLDAEPKPSALRLTVQRFGKPQPTRMEIVRDREHRSPSALKAARQQYARTLERHLERQFPSWTIAALTTSTDLEKSFGPAYARAMLRRGRSAWACLGVGSTETQPTIDGALTVGLLWLDHLREKYAADCVVEGLRLIVPARCSQVSRMRMHHLDRDLAKFELWELSERDYTLTQQDLDDIGNFATTLTRCPDTTRLQTRYAEALARVRRFLPDFEAHALNSSELSLRYKGLEFASIRAALAANSLELAEEIVFGVGPASITLTEDTEQIFAQLTERLQRGRGDQFNTQDPIWRARPERWLESILVRDIRLLDERLRRDPVYAQVPAFSASDRAVLDTLAVTTAGRLAVVEIKADDDLHLPLQGLDYWTRVRHHQQRGELQRYGYFADLQLSPEPPLLLLVAPALRVHPATDKVLRYLSPEIEWSVIGLDEHWRSNLRVIFRKRKD